ncbi:hypothetical protein PsorP6_016682 [Peronosclerospora sorghi]|uniref:Uncharacterized protein n=1 Tax=Peronosclerospora sorghi TaxID=230839 RepID=A0ACC0VP59_9STRA|nr:hypothetical protein PsorP6_016682 [Peronosclerospora sorghi]
MSDYEALLPVDAPQTLPKPRRRLHRMDFALLTVLLFVIGFITAHPPTVRTLNPLLLSKAPDEFQYMRYDDLDSIKRQSGYSVKYTARGFEIDGKHTLLLGGSIHYPRSTSGQWEQLLRDAKRDGLNHIEIYVFWNLHEQERGVFNFVGNANITQFYELAAQVGLFLHVRFGPYVCAEWSNGGLPVWLNWIEGMKVRSSNGPWQREMERFVRYMVELSRPFLAKHGGPIIMAQIENEFTGHDPEYVKWCGDLVKRLDTSIPWIMCYANAAENTILSCNDNDCVDFAIKHVKERPSDPLVWTEDEGWYQTWQTDTKNLLPKDQRTPEDVAYAVARWFAIGGASHNYYMYHGGNNYGRSASAGVTNMYADGVNLHSDGLSNEPKRSHLRKLHEALIECNDVLMRNDRQLLNPHNLSDMTQQWTASSSQQRAFVYGQDDEVDQVVFLENMDDKEVAVVFQKKKYDLAAHSMLVIKNETLLFNTADVKKSFPGHQRRVYNTLVGAYNLEWKTWSELNVSAWMPRKRVFAERPLEQLRLTADHSDYLTYETTFSLPQMDKLGSRNNDDAMTLKMTSCEANSIVAFIDGWLIGERNLAYPGGNCSKVFRFQLPMVDAARKHDLKLVSISLGINSLGSNHSKGLTGSVQIGHLDLTNTQEWTMYPSLIGEQLEIYRLLWLDSVPWTPVPRASAAGVKSGRKLMSWYRSFFRLPPQLLTVSKEKSSILLDFLGLTRGRAFINGHDLGRYWLINDEGDFIQRYYHVPLDWLLTDHENLLVVFDELGGSVADVRVVASTMVSASLSGEIDASLAAADSMTPSEATLLD